MPWRGVFLLFFFFLRPPSGLANKENAGEAELFCRIRLLAENDPEKLVFENEEREKDIMRQIEKVGPEIRGLVGKTDQRDASFITQFNDLVREAKKIMENMRDLRRKAAEKRLSAKRHLRQVIFGEYGGEGKGELDSSKETIQKIFNNEKFEESCGGNGNKPAGKSLINDFICLCASNTGFDAHFDSHHDKSICMYGVTTTVENEFSNWTEVWYWNKHRICINTAPPIPTPQNINYLVAHFTRFLEREQEKFQVKNVFGYVKDTDKGEASVCDGNATKTGGICVNYNHALHHGGIEWLNHLKNASQDLDDMGRFAEDSESTLPQLEMLEYNALLLYEEAKYSAHLPHAVPANETDTNSSNESYEESSPNASEEDKLEEEEDADFTWKGGPPWSGVIFIVSAF